MVMRIAYPRGFTEHPFRGLEHMRREMDQIFGALYGREAGPAAGVFPPMNVTQDPDSFHVRAELPGIDAAALSISALRNKITVNGERKLEEEKGTVSYHRREREGGQFSRSLTLPGDIDPDRVSARYLNGVLSITLPKAEESKPKRIAIRSA